MRRLFVRRVALIAVQALGIVVLVKPGALRAQGPVRYDVRHEAFAGVEIEEYLRVMQAAGAAAWYPWSVRAFSPAEVERMVRPDSAHPWDERFRFAPTDSGAVQAGWIPPRGRVVFNSAFPHGGNDGAVWAGRGVTSVLDGGAWARWGPLSLVVAPVMFRAENRDFELAPGSPSGDARFRDGRDGGDRIDLPQRFGDGSYARVSPGQSTLRVDLGPLAAAASTANQYWGPATHNPLLLGNNAEGYPHLFLGTSRPLDVGVGLVHGRMVWGRLEESAFSPGSEDLRFMSGIVGTFRPRGLPGFEIGGARFFHSPWPEEGFSLEDFIRPLEEFLKVKVEGDPDSSDNSDDDNQLASLFVRWAPPRTAFEIYAEYAREDHNWNLRDFMLEPDHDSAYLLGLRRVWAGNPRSWTVVRGEVMNAEVSHLFRVRPQVRYYVHHRMRQGHTVRGQILGSQHGYGGAATEVAVERYQPWGRWTATWSRALYDRRGSYWQAGIVERDAADTSHSLRGEVLWFRGNVELSARLEGLYRFNRHFEDDDVNLHAAVGVTWRP